MSEPLILHLQTGDELRVSGDRQELSEEIAGRPFLVCESGGKTITVFTEHIVWIEPVREGGGRPAA
jgi:hypothetical protein